MGGAGGRRRGVGGWRRFFHSLKGRKRKKIQVAGLGGHSYCGCCDEALCRCASSDSLSIEHGDHMFEVFGKGRGKDVEFVIGGQADFETPGVEHEGGIGEARVFFAVDGVAEDGAAEVGHVDAELMGAACAGIEGDEGVALG